MSARTFYEALRDPEEAPLLTRVLRELAAEEPRRQYARWLLARGDVRGELLAVAAQLEAAATPSDRDALRARFTALRATVDPMWFGVLRGAVQVLNCGAAKDRPPPVRFAFRCPKVWEEFAPTDAPGVRFCSDCAERVYLCRTRGEAETHARAGHCVAVGGELGKTMRTTLAKLAVGRPHVPALWAERIYGVAVDPRELGEGQDDWIG
jgi:hypothetical protein